MNDIDAEKSKAPLLRAKPDAVCRVHPFHPAVFPAKQVQDGVCRCLNIGPGRKRIFFRDIPEDVFILRCMLHPETAPGQGKAIQRTNGEVDGQKPR